MTAENNVQQLSSSLKIVTARDSAHPPQKTAANNASPQRASKPNNTTSVLLSSRPLSRCTQPQAQAAGTTHTVAASPRPHIQMTSL
ncbi:hypothetical protein BDR07DRAFT_1417922 [Suillus spraguei]|nr:hypothetical protein BDR07DRAFT_1417922 [Suillus spraguei]